MGSGRYTSQGRVLLWEWVLYQGRPVHHTSTMPLMLELKYEYFIADWPGRIKLTELVLGLLSMMCAAPAWDGVQHWFLLVVVVAFLGTIFFSLYYLCLAEPLNKLQVNWLMGEFGSLPPPHSSTSPPSWRCWLPTVRWMGETINTGSMLKLLPGCWDC